MKKGKLLSIFVKMKFSKWRAYIVYIPRKKIISIKRGFSYHPTKWCNTKEIIIILNWKQLWWMKKKNFLFYAHHSIICLKNKITIKESMYVCIALMLQIKIPLNLNRFPYENKIPCKMINCCTKYNKNYGINSILWYHSPSL